MSELWRCNECGEEFLEQGYEECPFCGSEDVYEAYMAEEWLYEGQEQEDGCADDLQSP